MEIVTYEILFEVLKKLLMKRGMDVKEISDLTYFILNFFGFGDFVVDNTLTSADRHVFNTLEELGILRTFEDEITISRGKLWRIHYWTYRKDNIERIFESDEVEEEKNAAEIYKELFENEEE